MYVVNLKDLNEVEKPLKYLSSNSTAENSLEYKFENILYFFSLVNFGTISRFGNWYAPVKPPSTELA